jgi:hypothetical protein
MKLEKIESFEALKQRFEALRHLLGSRVEGGAPNNQFEREVLVCGGTGCVSSDSSKIVRKPSVGNRCLRTFNKNSGIKNRVLWILRKGPYRADTT